MHSNPQGGGTRGTDVIPKQNGIHRLGQLRRAYGLTYVSSNVARRTVINKTHHPGKPITDESAINLQFSNTKDGSVTIEDTKEFWA